MVAQACNPSTWEMKAREFKDSLGYNAYHEANMGYVKLCLKDEIDLFLRIAAIVGSICMSVVRLASR